MIKRWFLASILVAGRAQHSIVVWIEFLQKRIKKKKWKYWIKLKSKVGFSSLGIGLRNQKVFTKEPWVWEKENMSWKSENIERGRKALLAMVFCHSHLPKPGNVKMFYNTKKVSPKKFQLKEKNIYIYMCTLSKERKWEIFCIQKELLLPLFANPHRIPFTWTLFFR